MKPFAILALMFASVAICQQEDFQVKELSSQELDSLEVLRRNARAADEVMAKAQKESERAWEAVRAKESEISKTFHPEQTPCVSGKTHIRSAIVRGKYVLISEFDQSCGNLTGGGTILFGDAK